MRNCLIVLIVLFAGIAFGDDKPAEASHADAKEAPKRKPKKLAEYNNWEAASAAAEAWEQPVLAFVEVAGDSDAAKLRTMTVDMRQPLDFKKEFISKNMVYYHIRVPSVKEKRSQGNNNQKRVKAPPKPDFSALKTDERVAVQRLIGGQGSHGGGGVLPAIVVTDAAGQVLTNLGSFAPESLASFVDDLKSAMESKKYPVEISPKLQRALEKEKKQKEKQKK